MKGAVYYGCYGFGFPVLTVRDPEMVKHVFVKDFVNFSDRNAPQNVDAVTDRENNFVDRIWLKTLLLSRGLMN